MKRRTFIGACGAAALASSWTRRSRAASRPNFLVILTDDQTFRAIGYNNPLVRTPSLDRLAGEGIVFDRAFIATPICLASRASLLTGVFPQQHQSVGLDPAGFNKNVLEDRKLTTLPEALGKQGYICAFAGKSHLGDPAPYGFNEGSENKPRDDDEAFAFASSFLSQRGADGKPFLLWLATHQPHVPLVPGDEWTDLYRDQEIPLDPNFKVDPPEGSLFNQGLPGERFYRDSGATNNFNQARSGPPREAEEMKDFIRGYYATISRLDAQIGKTIDDLKQAGLYDNTAIVFLSDNGYMLGNHGLGNKIVMLEESVRVPMFVSWKGLPNKGVRCGELVSSLDVYPTLLDLAGVEKPKQLEGQSLVPLFENPDRPLHEVVFSECVGVGGKPGQGHRMARTKRWKYILTDENEEALFDEEEDPYELNNLASSQEHQDILNELRSHLREWMKEVGDRDWPFGEP
jgi:arylsulfatase A-like enzyme